MHEENTATANLFWNARERRLRTGWRLLVFLVIVFLVAAVDGRVGAGLAGRLPDLYEDLVRALVFALLIVAALYLASRVLDHRRMSDYGFHFSRRWWTDLGFGLVLGSLLLFGVLAVALAVGWVKVTGSFATDPWPGCSTRRSLPTTTRDLIGPYARWFLRESTASRRVHGIEAPDIRYRDSLSDGTVSRFAPTVGRSGDLAEVRWAAVNLLVWGRVGTFDP